MDVFVVYSKQVLRATKLVPFNEFFSVLEVDIFDLGFLFVADFDAIVPDDFYAVVFRGIVRCRDDYATIKLVTLYG